MRKKMILLILLASFSVSTSSYAGGYVDSEVTEDPSFSFENFWNNIFSGEFLNSFINNDLIKTPSTLDPVSTVTGNMYHDETDILIPGRGVSYVFTRTYNSGQVALAGNGLPLSPGWTHSYNMRLRSNDYGQFPNFLVADAPENENGTTSSVTYLNERGGEANFLVSDTGGSPIWTVTSPESTFDTLQLNTTADGSPSIGTHTLTFRNGVKYIFFSGSDMHAPDQIASLSQILDPYGNALNFTYDGSGRLTVIADNTGVVDRDGLTLAYDGGGRLTSVSDWDSRTWTYAYDSNNRLVSVTNPLIETITYSYFNDGDLLTAVTWPEDRGADEFAKATFTYYQNARTFQNANGLGETDTLDYDLFRKRTRVEGAAGFVRTYTYDKKGSMTRLELQDGAILRFSNDDDGLRFAKFNALGYETKYSYNSSLLNRSFGSASGDNFGRVSKEQDALDNFVEYDYGLFDQLTVVRDKRGTVRASTYYEDTDPATGAVQGKLERVEITLAGGPVTLAEFTYTESGNLEEKTEFIDPDDLTKVRVTTFTYEDPHDFNLLSVTVTGEPGDESVTTSFTYDNLGRKLTETVDRETSATDATLIPLKTTYAYDLLSRVVAVTDPLGNIRRTDYDANGKVSRESVDFYLDDNGTPGIPLDDNYDTRVYATYTYDAADRVISQKDVDGNDTQYEYDSRGNVIAITDANGHITQYEYDAMSRRTAVIEATGGTTRMFYDLAGQIVKTVDGNGNATSFEYDEVGRQTKITTALLLVTSLTYDANGNVLTVTDPENRVTAHVYDEFNRRIQTTDPAPAGGVTKFSYDLLGNRTSLEDAEQRVTAFKYDELGRLIETVDPLLQSPTDETTVYTYDKLGNVLTMVDRNGKTVRYTYDNLNRLAKKDFVEDETQEDFTYDTFGNLAQVANGSVAYDYTYDTQHRLIGKIDTRTGSVRSLDWAYDAVGKILTKTGYDGFVTSYQYNSANQLTAMSNPDHLQVSYFYDPAGRLVNRILSNGVKSFYSYDADNRLLDLHNESQTGTLVNQQVYQYDGVGNITQIDRGPAGAIQTTVNTYDALNRLTNVDAPGTANDHAYTYDLVGNRLTWVRDGNTLAYVYNENNQLEEVLHDTNAGALFRAYTYDGNGSRIEKRDASNSLLESYSYDQKNRMLQMVKDTITYSYKYDLSDYRIENKIGSTERKYYLEGEHLEAVADASNTLTDRYLRGVVIDEIVHGYHYDNQGSETAISFHHDHLRSVKGMSDRLGGVLSTSEYGPFGGLE